MKKKASQARRDPDRDTMRPEYDFSSGVRGATAARYAKGANVVVLDPDVLDVFPHSASERNRIISARLATRRERRVHESSEERRR